MSPFWPACLLISLALVACGVREGAATQPEVTAVVTAPVELTPSPIPTTAELSSAQSSLEIMLRQPDEALLRDVWPQPAGVPPTRLLYFMRRSAFRLSPDGPVFATFDLQTGGTTDLPTILPTNELGQGQLSPDGQWIAYGVITGDNSSDLLVLRTDGTQAATVAHNVGTVPQDCEIYLAWSPDSTRLAYNHYDADATEPGWRLTVTALNDLNTATTVAASTFLKLLGWTDATHVVFGIGTPENLLQVEQVNVDDQSRRVVVGPYDRGTGLACVRFAANRQQAMLQLTTATQLLDVPSGTVGSFGVGADRIVWSYDGNTILHFPSLLPYDFPLRAGVVSSTTLEIDQPISILPLPTPGTTHRWSDLNASPDGQYVSVCQATDREDGTSRQALLVYSVAQNQWRVAANDCFPVIGWQ